MLIFHCCSHISVNCLQKWLAPLGSPLVLGSGGGRTGVSVPRVGVLWHYSGNYVTQHKWENCFLALK